MMSFSNYPREADVVPSERLEKFVKLGLIWGSLMQLGYGIFVCLDQAGMLDSNWEDNNATAIPVLLMFVASAVFTLLFAVQIFKWVWLAWTMTVRVRSLRPRLSANGAAWLSVVPFVNLISLAYIMDFLVIRSRSAETQTLGPFSVASADPRTTWFCYCIALQLLLTIAPYFSSVTRRIDTDGIVFTGVDFALQIVGFVLGYKLSVQVNEQLKTLATKTV